MRLSKTDLLKICETLPDAEKHYRQYGAIDLKLNILTMRPLRSYHEGPIPSPAVEVRNQLTFRVIDTDHGLDWVWFDYEM